MTCFAAMMRSLTCASVSPVCAIGLILNRRMRWTRAQTDSTEKGKVLGQLRITHDGRKGRERRTFGEAPSDARSRTRREGNEGILVILLQESLGSVLLDVLSPVARVVVQTDDAV